MRLTSIVGKIGLRFNRSPYLNGGSNIATNLPLENKEKLVKIVSPRKNEIGRINSKEDDRDLNLQGDDLIYFIIIECSQGLSLKPSSWRYVS